MAQRIWLSSDTSKWNESFGLGSDGALNITSDTTETVIDSACTGTIGTNSLSATNASFSSGQFILIHQTKGTGIGNPELNKIDSYTAGTITTSYPLVATYASGAQVRVLKQFSSANVASGVTYTTKAWDGTVGGILSFFVNGDVTIAGSISANGKGFVLGGGGGPGQNGTNGEVSTVNGGEGGDYSNDAGGGGGGGGCLNAGSSGGTHVGAGGDGGGATGNTAMTSFTLGGGGGGGGRGDYDNANGRNGGNGGGIIFIVAKNITVTGSLLSHGNGGTDGYFSGGGGGGGAGGGILLKGKNLSLGTNLVLSSGGSGGSLGSGAHYGGGGGGGSNGIIQAYYSSSISGSITGLFDATIKEKTSGFFALNFK